MVGIDFKLVPDTEFKNFDLVVCPVANSKGSVAITQQACVAMIILSLARQLGKRVSVITKKTKFIHNFNEVSLF